MNRVDRVGVTASTYVDRTPTKTPEDPPVSRRPPARPPSSPPLVHSHSPPTHRLTDSQMDFIQVTKSLRAMRDFVKGGGDVNTIDSRGNSIPWVLYTHSKATAYYKLFLDGGGDVNATLPHGHGASIVTSIQDVDKLKMFVERGADLHRVDNKGSTYAHYATDRRALGFAVEMGGVDVKKRNNRGQTALHVYVKRYRELGGVVPFVSNYLLGCGLDINDGDAAGRRAVHDCHLADVQYLVSKGADITLTDNMGRTCLHHNVRRGHLRSTTTDMYTSGGVDINARDSLGRPALHMSRGRLSSTFLVRRGADPNIVDNHGRSVVHLVSSVIAVTRGNPDAVDHVRALILMGADLNVADNDGKMCLDDLLSVVKVVRPSSKDGKKCYEVLKVAVENGLDLDRYGAAVLDIVSDEVRGKKVDPVVKKAATRWYSRHSRYTMVLVRHLLCREASMEEPSASAKKTRVVDDGYGAVRKAALSCDDVFRKITGFL